MSFEVCCLIPGWTIGRSVFREIILSVKQNKSARGHFTTHFSKILTVKAVIISQARASIFSDTGLQLLCTGVIQLTLQQ